MQIGPSRFIPTADGFIEALRACHEAEAERDYALDQAAELWDERDALRRRVKELEADLDAALSIIEGEL